MRWEAKAKRIKGSWKKRACQTGCCEWVMKMEEVTSFVRVKRKLAEKQGDENEDRKKVLGKRVAISVS